MGEDSLVELTELEAMLDQQMAHVNIACVIKWLEANHWQDGAKVAAYSEETKVYWSQWDTLGMRDGQLYRRWESPAGILLKWQLQ